MKTLSAGYFLSAFHALNFTPAVFVTIYPSLITFPVSIVLRGLGWTRLKSRMGGTASASYLVWILGLLTYVFLLAEFSETFGGALKIAAATWTIYSALEAFLYLSAAKTFEVTIFRIAPISLAAVAIIDFLIFTNMVSIRMAETADPIVQLIFAAAGFMFVSAVSAGVAAAKIKPLEVTVSSKKQVYLPPGPVARQPIASVKVTAVRPSVKVIRPSKTILCPSCRYKNPVENEVCVVCGAAFPKAYSGLACPVCQGPLTMAKPLSNRRYLCGVCASTIELTR